MATPLRADSAPFAASGPLAASAVLERLSVVRPVTLAALLRIARQISEGFEGKVQLVIASGGVRSMEWIKTESGNSILEELE